MKRGGIFAGPNALGTYGFGATGQSCTPDNSALIMKVQQYLQQHGAPNLKIDGQWQGCTASAYNKVFGKPIVTCGDMETMGIQCSSDDCLLGPFAVLPAFTIAGINACTDGSDGTSTGTTTPGGTQQQQCPSGQAWNTLLNMCLPTGIPNVSPPADNTQPAGACPPGTYGFPPACFPNPLAPPADSKTPASGGCPAGQTGFPPFCVALPGQKTPGQNCPSGSVLTPAGCVGQNGVTTPTACPEGQMQLPFVGTCVPNPLAKTPGVPSGGACPAGQTGFPPFCFSMPGGKDTTMPSDLLGGLMTTITGLFGPQGANCPAGSVYNPTTKGCVGPAGPVQPVGPVGPVVPTPSPFGKMAYVIVGLLALGGVVGGYVLYKKRQEQAFMGYGPGAFDPSLDPSIGMAGFDELGGPYDMSMYDPYADPYADMYSNRKRRGRKSRRRGRGRRRNRC